MNVTAVNDAPTLDVISNLGLAEDASAQTVNLSGMSVGPGNEVGQALTVTASSSNTGLIPNPTVSYTSPNATGTLMFQPVSNANGTATITVTVHDNGGVSNGGVDTATRTFTVSVSAVNDAPVLNAIAEQTAAEGSQLKVTATASDVDGDTLRFSLNTGAPTGAQIDAASGSFIWTPSEEQGPGDYAITVRVTESGATSSTAERLFNVHVTEANQAPVLAVIADQTVAPEAVLRVQVSATDSDLPANRLTFSLGSGAPAGLQIVSTSGLLTWIPSATQAAGKFPVTVTVTDDGSPSLNARQTFNVEVKANNHAPMIGTIVNQQVARGQTLTVNATASDSDVPAQTLTWALSAGAPVGMTINPSSGTVTWTPGATEANGEHRVTMRVTDNGVPPLTAEKTFSVQLTGSAGGAGGVLSTVYFQSNDGTIGFWKMNNEKYAENGNLNPSKPASGSWSVVAVADFDRDGTQDLLLQEADGTMVVWYLNGADVRAGAFLNPSQTGDLDWQVAGTGDFNGDGQTDLLFQHTDSTLAVWLMKAVTLVEPQLLDPPMPDSIAWRIVGAGDFDGDAKSDLLFQHSIDGRLVAWMMNGTSLKSSSLLEPAKVDGPGAVVMGIMDLDHDGKVDLLFQASDESRSVWFMDGIKRRAAKAFDPARSNPGWRIVGP